MYNYQLHIYLIKNFRLSCLNNQFEKSALINIYTVKMINLDAIG